MGELLIIGTRGEIFRPGCTVTYLRHGAKLFATKKENFDFGIIRLLTNLLTVNRWIVDDVYIPVHKPLDNVHKHMNK